MLLKRSQNLGQTLKHICAANMKLPLALGMLGKAEVKTCGCIYNSTVS